MRSTLGEGGLPLKNVKKGPERVKTKTKCTPRREVRFGRDDRLLGGVAEVGTRHLARVQTKIKEKAPNAIFALGPSTGSKLQKGCPALSASASIQAKEKSPNAHCVQTQSGFVLQKRYPLKMRISDSEEIRFHFTA